MPQYHSGVFNYDHMHHAGSKPLCSFEKFGKASHADVLKIIKSNKIKACSLDPVPACVFKTCLEILLPALTDMTNQSFQTGTFPSSLKSALIIPTLKSPSVDPETLKNYRPISNLPFPGKVIERIVSQQLMTYLNSISLLPSRQSAYRQHHSVETALIRVQNDLLQSLDTGNEAVLLLLDLTSAFDTVDHSILLTRLRDRFGVTGMALHWFASYLSRRQQSVLVKDVKSNPRTLLWGVPQGSQHVNNTCKKASLALRRIGRIRHYLNSRTTEILVHAFITSLFDNYNCFLLGAPERELVMDRESVEKTAFRVQWGLYEFLCMPQGLCNSPGTFQTTMEFIIGDMNLTEVVLYLDEILIFSSTLDEQLKRLDKVMTRLQDNGLRLKGKKCFFLKEKFSYLGHVVSRECIDVDEEKVKRIREWPTPTNGREVSSFLGLASYYRRLISEFARIAGPLHTVSA
eukprot:XP_011670772.1 PREDICTED: uncharacterized protein LOC105441399 [Strongylocentrotus purpuratus]